MTDMRATERLLEVIQEGLVVLSDRNSVDDLIEAVSELRRRGDTLVRADDLREALLEVEGMLTEYGHAQAPAYYQRLENAIGGKLR